MRLEVIYVKARIGRRGVRTALAGAKSNGILRRTRPDVSCLFRHVVGRARSGFAFARIASLDCEIIHLPVGIDVVSPRAGH